MRTKIKRIFRAPGGVSSAQIKIMSAVNGTAVNDPAVNTTPSSDTSLDSFVAQLTTLQAQIEHLESILDGIRHGSLSSPVSVHIGSDPLGTMSDDEALAFVNSRMQQKQRALHELKQKLLLEASSEPLVNEEGLLIVDILEELDDEGNVINVKLNEKEFSPRTSDQPTDVGESEEVSSAMASPVSTNVVSEQIHETPDMAPCPTAADELDLAYVDVQEELDEDGNVIGVKFNDKVVWNKQDENTKEPSEAKIVDVTNEAHTSSTSITEHSKDDLIDDPKEQFQELLDDMEVYKRVPNQKSLNLVDPIELLEKIDSLEISADDKFKLKGMCMDAQRADSDYESAAAAEIPSTDKHQLSDSSLTQQELIELQILADEFDDATAHGDELVDDEEWDFDFDDDDDEDDDSYADEILYGARNVLGPSIDERAQLLLVDQVMKLREAKYVQAKPKESAKPAKSVRFSETLQIKEIENVSEDLRNAQTSRISLFKQNRAVSGFKPQTRVEYRQENGTASNPSAQPKAKDLVNDLPMTAVADRTVDHAPQLDGFEYSEPVSDIVEKQVSMPDTELPVSDIVERPLTVSDTDSPVSDIVERPFAVSDTGSPLLKIVERTNSETIAGKEASFSGISASSNTGKIPPPSDNVVKSTGMSCEDPIDRKCMLDQSIAEVEGSSDLFSPAPKKLSKFKQRVAEKNGTSFQMCHQSNSNSTASMIQGISGTQEVHDQGQENDAENKTIASNEKQASTSINNDKKKENVLRFKASRQGKPPAASIPKAAKYEAETEPIKEATIDYQLLQSDTDTMAKAYLLGMYDDDLGDQGTVVHSLGDFETLNRVVESMSSNGTSHEPEHNLNTHTHDEQNEEDDGYNEIIPQSDDEAENCGDCRDQQGSGDYNLNDEQDYGNENTDDSEDDSPIMQDIMEHSTNNHLDMDSEDYALSSETLNREVSESYHRLRHKMIAKNGGYRRTDAEKEFEPIVPLATSRFKQARLSMGK